MAPFLEAALKRQLEDPLKNGKQRGAVRDFDFKRVSFRDFSFSPAESTCFPRSFTTAAGNHQIYSMELDAPNGQAGKSLMEGTKLRINWPERMSSRSVNVDAIDSPAEDRPAHPQTRWSLIARVQTNDPRVRENALNELLTIYCPVLRKYLVAGMGLSPDTAADLLQGFVADRILSQDALASVRAEAGRFRNFLLTACRHYVISEMRKQQALKRAPAAAPSSVDELHSLPSADPSQQHLYNLEWARHTLAEALARMRRECEQKRRTDLWEIFDGRIIQPLLGGETALPYETLVARYGFQSPTQASNALITAKRMFKRLLEDVVRDTVETDAEVEEEIRDLKQILSK